MCVCEREREGEREREREREREKERETYLWDDQGNPKNSKVAHFMKKNKAE